MFTGELAESRQTEVVIRDIDERAMELLIDFAYTSQVAQFITHKKKMPKQKKKKIQKNKWKRWLCVMTGRHCALGQCMLNVT